MTFSMNKPLHDKIILNVKDGILLNCMMNLDVCHDLKALSNRDICLIEAVLQWCELFSLNFASHGLSCPPPSHKNRRGVKV